MTGTSTASNPPPGLLARLLSPLSSVTLGISLMVLLFIYSTIGSAGIVYPVHPNILDGNNWVYAQLRTFRGLEMTEYEWFNWWPFKLIIGLMCLNIIVVTLRRIKLNTINLGVWMIHSGILILCVGSVMYFSTKVEGDVPVVRRQVNIQLPSGETGTLRAIPGAGATLGQGFGRWQFQVSSINPAYTMLSGPDEGEQFYAVTVSVTPPASEPFMRQLIVGHPENTEDVIRSGDPNQPMQRAIKARGTALVNEDLQLTLGYLPATEFYLANWVTKSWALYLRERLNDGSTTEWAQRPLEGMPLFNDYIASAEDVWLEPGQRLPPDPLDVVANSSEAHDPLAGVPIRVDSYLRYALLEQKRVPGGTALDPTLELVLEDGRGGHSEHTLSALRHDHEQHEALPFAEFKWASSLDERSQLAVSRPWRVLLSVPDAAAGVGATAEITLDASSLADEELPFLPLGTSGYSYRLEFAQELDDVGVMASVEIQGPERSFRRWVFADGQPPRDVSPAPGADSEGEPSLIPREILNLDLALDARLLEPQTPPPVLFVAGPGDDDLGVVLSVDGPQDGQYLPLLLGEPIALGQPGVTLKVDSYSARSRMDVRPLVVPLASRRKDVREGRSMVRIRFDVAGKPESSWLRFHQYVFDVPDDPSARGSPALSRFPFGQATVITEDNRVLELMLSRQRMELPVPVVLDDFVLTSHVGGFSGGTLSILNWTSHVRFADGDGWGPVQEVTVNGPSENSDLWFFQSAWDPPDSGRFAGQTRSEGLNYTVLGVGNRNGVVVQLFGCAVSVIGMIYAFYVKPQLLLKRRKKKKLAGKRSSPQGLAATA
jgi:hypothetical protein